MGEVSKTKRIINLKEERMRIFYASEPCSGMYRKSKHDKLIGQIGTWYLIEENGNYFLLHGARGSFGWKHGICVLCGETPPAGLLFLRKLNG